MNSIAALTLLLLAPTLAPREGLTIEIRYPDALITVVSSRPWSVFWSGDPSRGWTRLAGPRYPRPGQTDVVTFRDTGWVAIANRSFYFLDTSPPPPTKPARTTARPCRREIARRLPTAR